MKHTEKLILLPYDLYKRQYLTQDPADTAQSNVTPAVQPAVISHTSKTEAPSNSENIKEFDVEKFITYMSRCQDGACNDDSDELGSDTHPYTENRTGPPLYKKSKKQWLNI